MTTRSSPLSNLEERRTPEQQAALDALVRENEADGAYDLPKGHKRIIAGGYEVERMSEPGAALEVERINLTPEQRKALTVPVDAFKRYAPNYASRGGPLKTNDDTKPLWRAALWVAAWGTVMLVGGWYLWRAWRWGLLLGVFVMGGCVSAGYRSGTIDHPDGRKETYRAVKYTDMREGAQGAMDFVSGVGGNLLGAGGLTGLASGGGIVGVLGLLWRNSAVNKARKVAHDDGWDARERAAMVQQPLPKPVTDNVVWTPAGPVDTDPGTGNVTEVA